MKTLIKYINEANQIDLTPKGSSFKEHVKYSHNDWSKWVENIYTNANNHIVLSNDTSGVILIYLEVDKKLQHIATYNPKTTTLMCDDIHLFGNEVKESVEDGKNGHYEEFVDEDTGEIVTVWINDPTPEEIASKEKEREESARSYYEKQQQENDMRKQLKLDELDDIVWDLEEQLKDLNREYRDLRIDMEEDLGNLYSQGKEAEAEKLAQKYGDHENKIVKQQESLRKKLIAAKRKRDNASSKFWKFYNKLWDNK